MKVLCSHTRVARMYRERRLPETNQVCMYFHGLLTVSEKHKEVLTAIVIRKNVRAQNAQEPR
jgi:hypothetical protein